MAKRCSGCSHGYPRAWCMIENQWQHCNCGVYWNCTAVDAKDPPPELVRR